MKRKSRTVTRLGVGRRMPVQPTVLTVAVSLIITLIVEALSRRSVGAVFSFIGANPLAFALSWALVAFTFSIAMMFRKKAFTLTFTSILWLAAGIVNCVILSQRTGLPLSASDLAINMDAILIAPKYYTWLQLALYALAAIALITALVFLFIKTPLYRRDLKTAFMRLMAFALILTLLLFVSIETGKVSFTLKPSLYDAYMNYGFPYSFTWSFFDTGIQKPENYSPETVQQAAEDMEITLAETPAPAPDRNLIETFREYLRTGELNSTPDNYTAESVETLRSLIASDSSVVTGNEPNFIFLQLESFCDPMMFTNYSISGDPVEYFRSLSESWPSGRLHVPTVSGGTANTEFEVLTGCNLDFFGTNDVPFVSTLRENMCESLATDLKLLDYRTAFLHTYTGSFYYRNEVYNNLDFDNFVSLEYMDPTGTTPTGWAKDATLTGYILKALETSETRDFIYAVSVQTHGSYPALPDDLTCPFTVETEAGDDARFAMEYYITMLDETDDFIKQLTSELSALDEPTVLVLYGDHLPGLTYEASDIEGGDMYSTQYVIWANFPLENVKKDLEAYQLGAYTLGLFGLNPGLMVSFHQTQSETPDYLENMKLLEYDMMFGSHYVYGGVTLTRTDEMQFGLEPITAETAQNNRGHLFVYGSGFTPSSVIEINGSGVDTIFVNSGLIIAPGCEAKADEAVRVSQVTANGTALSTTNEVYAK